MNDNASVCGGVLRGEKIAEVELDEDLLISTMHQFFELEPQVMMMIYYECMYY